MAAFLTISILVCAVLYRIKGGWHKKLWNPKGPLEWFWDGNQLSALFFALWCLLFFSPIYAAVLGFCWWLAALPSVGEEIGAVGGYKGAWGPYIDKGFGRSYGIKKATQRGVFAGAVLALGFDSAAPILLGALFPVAYFIGVSIEQWRTGQLNPSWHLGEWIYGAILGLSFWVVIWT